MRHKQVLCGVFCGFLFIGQPAAGRAETVKLSGFPLGLYPGESADGAQKALTGQGLTIYRTSGLLSNPKMVLWRLSGQVRYKDFAPTLFNTKFEDGKLTSAWLGIYKIPSCDIAWRAYQSACEFVKTQYAVEGAKIDIPSAKSPTCDKGTGSLSDFGLVRSKAFDYEPEVMGDTGDYDLRLRYEMPRPRRK